jgi:SAM-dependent methyltransferase
MAPDQLTASYYEAHAAELAHRYNAVASPAARFFATAFPVGARVLDVGAGSGRDLHELLAAGYDATGVEPSVALRAAAVQAFPELANRLMAGHLPQLANPSNEPFDGVLCSAVLMHIPEGDLFDTAFALRRLLKPHGRLLLSLPLQRDDVAADERDAHGRLFKGYTAEYLQLLFERIGFQLIGRWDTGDALGRSGTRWYTLLLELRAGGALRAVDQIEGILNRDRKVATYKLALFKALAEIATQESRTARWHANGEVAVPIQRIAERWLVYFWPIFASATLVPQSQSEGAGSAQPVAFRAPMKALMAAFTAQGEHGGLTSWHAAWTAGHLPPEVVVLQRVALRSIAVAIRNGPVTHSGGSLDTGNVFTYDATTASVRMNAELWRELTLMGHWIIDAVVVRWASLTERFGHRQSVTAGDVLPLLLARPASERTTLLARQIYLDAGVDRCAWSGRMIGRRFAVDHVIPFSLWGNNDLWNLLPVDARLNGQKSDKLPTAVLIHDSRNAIVQSWQVLRCAAPGAFDRQAAHLLGRPIGGPLKWEDDLLGCLREAIEMTALQRGVERWAPSVA